MTRLLHALTWFGIALLLALPSFNWFGPAVTGGLVAGAGTRVLTMAERLGAWLLVMPPYVIIAAGLYQVTRFCRSLQQEAVFTTAAMTALRRFGWSLIIGSLLFPASRLAFAFWMAQGDWPVLPPKLGAAVGLILLLYVAIGVLFGLILVVFATLLGEAKRLAEENASFV